MTEKPVPAVAARIDARDLICPLPVLKARKALKGLADGDVLEVLTTDPGAPADFKAFCEATQHHLISADDLADGVTRFLIGCG